MRNRRGKGNEQAAVDLTPMLDIVFILLIFFIVTATFIRERGLDVTRPPSNEATISRQVAIPVQIDAQNTIFIDGAVTDTRGVRARIEQLRAENPKGPVIIQADPSADIGVTVLVFDQARLAGAPGVAIQPRESR